MKTLQNIYADGTHDDWSALQHALDTQDSVILKRGVFRVTRPLVIKRAGQRISGAAGAVLLYDAPCGEALRIRAENVCVSKLTIQSEYDRRSACAYENTGIFASHAHGITLRDLHLYGFCTNLLLWDTRRAKILRCGIHQARIGGVEASRCCKLQIKGCRFLANGWMERNVAKLSGFGNTGVALRLEQAEDISLTECVFLHNARAIWAMHVDRLFGLDCIEKQQVRDSLIYGNAEFSGGSGFDDESIFIG